MADAECRFCDQAADAGPYCSTWIADLMAKALNPFSTAASGRRGKRELPQRGLPSTGPVPVMKGPVDI
jgi:hypothetical protein